MRGNRVQYVIPGGCWRVGGVGGADGELIESCQLILVGLASGKLSPSWWVLLIDNFLKLQGEMTNVLLSLSRK